jgi:hypothetical protein
MQKMTAHIIGIVMLMVSCTNRDTTVDKSTLLGGDYRLFQKTPAWELAKAVDDGDINKIKQEVNKNRSLLNFREPRFGQPLLKMAVMNENFKSVEILAELGADPNLQDNYDGSSPLMEAAQIGGGGLNHTGSDPRYLIFLIRHGGNVNAEENGARKQGNAVRHTPLLIACYEGNFDYVKILVNAGANVNYTNEFAENSLNAAFVGRNPDIVTYLLEKGADYKQPMFTNAKGQQEYISDELRLWCFDLNSEEYKKKMQIVDFLNNHGIDYRKSEIPAGFFKQYNKEYLEKY